MRKTLIAVVLAGYSAFTWASFDVVALGTQGGLSGDNLTSYLIRTEGDARYIALDAGSTLPGIAKGIEKGVSRTSPQKKLHRSRRRATFFVSRLTPISSATLIWITLLV